ncbi:MAG: 1-acyl-sn-glycerol-3-phosphate acyltransferase [Deltaproteobacteria bacterium]|nr:1-acyl-sn-glycerol-3-phosphate acyltransferase [Candidatus Tharpella sp.]
MNLWVYPLLFLWTLFGLLISPVAFCFWKVATGWSVARIIRHFIWLYGRGWMVIVAPFVSFEMKGFDNHYRSRTPCVYIINHLSFFDTFCMAMQPVSDIAFAVRAWPFRRLFWYTTFMWLARYLDVEELGFAESTEQSRAIVAAGGSILFYPEGHRSRDGQLQRFYSGAFLLAIKLDVPLVPLCISGTDILLPPGAFRMHPAKIRMHALALVDPAAFSGPEAHVTIRKQVKDAMARELADMRG